jgi:hypothetical protein
MFALSQCSPRPLQVRKSRRCALLPVVLICVLVQGSLEPPTLTALATEAIDNVPITRGFAVPGKGYSKNEEEFKGDCVIYEPSRTVLVGSPESTVSFTRSMTQNELQQSLGYSVGSRARFGVVQVSASAEFAREATSSAYAETTTYQAVYTFKNTYLKTRELEGFARKMIGSDGFASTEFVDNCGDQWVEQIRRGAKLLINVRLEFSSNAERQRFAAEFGVQGPAAAVSGKLEQASKAFGRSASITISAYQLGGDVSRLSTLFSRGEVNADEPKTTHALLRCSMTDLQPCLEVLSSAIDYATNPTESDAFPQQIRTDFNAAGSGAADLTYVTKPYSEIGVRVRPQELAAAVRNARKQLGNALERQLNLKIRVDSVRGEQFRLSPAQSDLVRKYADLFQGNITLLVEAATECYQDEARCVKLAEQADKELTAREEAAGFTPSSLDILPETFAQWCDQTGYGTSVAVPALQRTRDVIEALVTVARRAGVNTTDDKAWANVPDKCRFAQDVLMKLSEVAISSTPIRDLRPVTTLSNLESLVLNNVGLEDADVQGARWGNFGNLTRLVLSSNGISRVSPFLSLQNLTVLDLSDNRVSDVSTLSKLRQLRHLVLIANPLQNRSCPLAQPAWCVFD